MFLICFTNRAIRPVLWSDPDPDHLDRLAEDIEARFGKGEHRSVPADDFRPTPLLHCPSPDDEEIPF